jgi:hypothetical protein
MVLRYKGRHLAKVTKETLAKGRLHIVDALVMVTFICDVYFNFLWNYFHRINVNIKSIYALFNSKINVVLYFHFSCGGVLVGFSYSTRIF